jgi:hypothetical protein
MIGQEPVPVGSLAGLQIGQVLFEHSRQLLRGGCVRIDRTRWSRFVMGHG